MRDWLVRMEEKGDGVLHVNSEITISKSVITR